MITTRDPFLRLPPDIVCVTTSQRVALYSKSGAMLLDGPDARVVVETVFPLLDGTRTANELFEAIPEIEPADLTYILQELQDHGLLEDCLQSDSVIPSEEESRLRLQKARVVISGVEPWTTLSAEAIRAEGVGHVTVGFKEDSASDIAVGAFDGSDKASLRDFAEFTNKMQIPSLTCAIYENEVIIGPFAVPGRTACWNCGYLRLTANAAWNDSRSNTGDNTGKKDALIGSLIARQVCDAVSRADSGSRLINYILVFDKRSSGTSLHRVLAVPGCEVCGGPTASQSLDSSEENQASSRSPAELVLRALSWFVDSRTGIINQVTFERSADTGLEMPAIATAIPAHAPGEFAPLSHMPTGWGKGITSAEAVIGAVGEAIERYSASMPDPVRIVWSRPADLPGDVLDPPMFALYGEDQYARSNFSYVRFDPSVSHPWVAGEWAGTQDPVWVPAILTYLSLVACPEHIFCQGTSNGLAAGTDPAEAALRAILELLERDTFMTSWRSKQPGQHVRLDQGLDPDLSAILSGIGDLGGRVELVLLESICGYPTAVCLGFGDGANWPGVTLGLGTDPDPRKAVRQAILEQGQTGPYLRRLMRTAAHAVPGCAQDVKQMLDHAIYYFPPERASAFDYLRDDSSACALADLPHKLDRSLRACSQALAGSGVRVGLVDVTSRDIAMSPFRVMRAVSPDLQPISFGYGLDRLSVPHLAALGVAASEDEIAPIW